MSISLKTKNDIEKMKIAGNYAAKVLEYLEDFVQVGISTEEIDNVAYIRYASVYRDFREAGDFGKFVEQEIKEL